MPLIGSLFSIFLQIYSICKEEKRNIYIVIKIKLVTIIVTSPVTRKNPCQQTKEDDKEKMRKIMAILVCSVLLMVGVGLSSALPRAPVETGAIDVTVLKSDATPAEGWTIEVTQLSGGVYHVTLIADANGHALFQTCSSGQYKVEAYKTPKFLYGSASTDQVFVTAPDVTYLELTLSGGLSMKMSQGQQSPS